MNEEIYEYALNHTWNDVASNFGITKEQARGRVRRYAKKNNLQGELNKSRISLGTWETLSATDKLGNETTKDVINGSDWAELKDKNEEDLLRFAGYDPAIFELSKSYFNQYGGQTSVRVEVKKKNFGVDVNQLADALKDIKNINVYRPDFN